MRGPAPSAGDHDWNKATRDHGGDFPPVDGRGWHFEEGLLCKQVAKQNQKDR